MLRCVFDGRSNDLLQHRIAGGAVRTKAFYQIAKADSLDGLHRRAQRGKISWKDVRPVAAPARSRSLTSEA